MSKVTDVILTCSLADEDDQTGEVPAIDSLNYLLMNCRIGRLKRVDEYWEKIQKMSDKDRAEDLSGWLDYREVFDADDIEEEDIEAEVE